MDEERRRRATSFGSVAGAYERARPGYPDDAVRWLAGEVPGDVVDLGAGTGKLTASLVALGHRVVAVEPLAEMRAQLEARLPRVPAFEGTAESMPLPDGSADVVTVAQAFHWFDHGPALAEIARVLRPGGHVALVWNVRDETEPWVAELGAAMVDRTGVDRGAVRSIGESGFFGPVEHTTFRHVQETTREGLRELVLSRSHCAVLAEAERAPILARVEELFEAHARDGILVLPYGVECFRARRLREEESPGP